MALGTVKWFNDAKGYGFISRSDDGKDVFVHYSSISGDGFRTLNQGQTVEYEEQQGPKGLFAAKVLKVMSSYTAERGGPGRVGPASVLPAQGAIQLPQAPAPRRVIGMA